MHRTSYADALLILRKSKLNIKSMRLIRDAGYPDQLELDDLERVELLGILDQWLTWRDSLKDDIGPLGTSALQPFARELASLLSP